MARPEKLHLPTPEDYLRVTQEVDADIERGGGAANYLMNYHNTQHDTSGVYRDFYDNLVKYGVIIEPVDRSTGVAFSDSLESAQTIVKGGVAGLIVMRRAHKLVPVARKALDYAVPGNPDTNDEETRKSMMAQQLVDFGWRGLEFVNEQTKDIFEKWEDKAVETASPHLFRLSIGILIFGTRALHQKMITDTEAEETAQFQSDTTSFFLKGDWDASLEELLRGDSSSDDPSQ